MTTIEFGRLTRSGETLHVHSWSASLIFHVLGVWCAIVLVAEIEKPNRPMPFTWEVAMIETPPKVEPAPQPPTPLPPMPARPRTTPQVQRTVDHRPPVETQTVQTQTVETVQQTVQDVVTPVEQITATPVETAIHRPRVQGVESPTAVVQAVTTTTVATVVETSQAVSQVVTETGSVTESAPVTEQAAVVHQPAVMQRESVTQSDFPLVEQKAVQHRVVQYRQVQADYGWLRDTLWKRIQELKRYPALARSNHWEGKVVVAAVIREDGTVVGLRIAESSGRPILDQEALSVMRQASPLTLKHPLGKPQVTILVPISYRLDG